MPPHEGLRRSCMAFRDAFVIVFSGPLGVLYPLAQAVSAYE